MIVTTITSMMDNINMHNFLPSQKDYPKTRDPTTVVPANKGAPPLDGEHYKNIGGMWNIKHEISSPNFYELLINTELSGYTDLVVKKFYNHINMCLSVVNRLLEDLLTSYHSTL